MTATDLDTLFNTALVTKLMAVAALQTLCSGNIYDTVKNDESVTDDYMVFQNVAGGDTNSSPRRDIDIVYRVEFISTQIANARAGAGYIEQALHQQELTITGWSNYRCECTDQVNLSDLVQSKIYYRKGRFVRVSADKIG
jgi:hypothetical protein